MASGEIQSSQHTSSNNSPPAVTITPASPTNTITPTLGTPIQASSAQADNSITSSSSSDPNPVSTSVAPNIGMKEKTPQPTDSETALLSKGAPKKDTTTPRTEKPSTTKSPSSSAVTPQSKPTTATSTTNAASSTSRPPQHTSAATTQKKKRKRTGLAGLFAALGCISATEFEDEKKDTGRNMAQKPGAAGVTKTTTGPAAKTTAAVDANKKDATGTPPAESSLGHHGETTDTTATTGTTLVEDQDKAVLDAAPGARAADAVVVAPVEPVTLPEDETAGVTSSAVQPPGAGAALGTPSRQLRRGSDTTPLPAATSTTSGDVDKTATSGGYTDISETDLRSGDDSGVTGHDEGDYGVEEEYEDEEDRLIAQGGMGIPLDENGHPTPLLPVMDKVHHGRKCLVLDLDETLLHSSFKMLPSADYIVPVEIESQTHNVYVIKRPGVDHFLTEMGKIYEIVVFTASLSKYADPVLDMLDPARVVRHRLFRESCYNHKGNYVKDLSQLGRDMEGCIIIDNSPASYIFHPNNAVPVSTWFNDPHDTELTDLCPFLADLATVDDIRGVLDGSI